MYEPGGGGPIPGIIGYEESQNTGDVITELWAIPYLTGVVLRVSIDVAPRLCLLLSRVLLVRWRWHRWGDRWGEMW